LRAEPIVSSPTPPVAIPVESSRQLPLDWLRGLVMVLMTIDHASGEFNAGRLFTDATFLYKPGTPLPLAQFLTRWITHLCAPVFVFLAGYVLQISVLRRQAQGESEGSITRFIVTRGLIIAALEVWMNLVFYPHAGRLIVLQVLYAIGLGFVAMAFLRRLPAGWLGALGVLLAFAAEPLREVLMRMGGTVAVVSAFVVGAGRVPPFVVGYPLLPWLAIMMMGWGAAALARSAPTRFPARAALAGILALAIFVAFRGLNGWGNMGLLRADGSLVQWLHVSKYPPSVTYDGLELGIGWLLLALFSVWRPPAWADAVLRPLGQSAFFFYLLHAHLLALVARSLHLEKGGLLSTYLASAAVIAVLVPACNVYRRYKLAHPRSFAQYI